MLTGYGCLYNGLDITNHGYPTVASSRVIVLSDMLIGGGKLCSGLDVPNNEYSLVVTINVSLRSGMFNLQKGRVMQWIGRGTNRGYPR